MTYNTFVDMSQNLPRRAAPAPQSKRSFNFYRNRTFIGLFIGYGGYYFCRQNLSAAYTPMKTALGLDPIAFGQIASFGTLCYALGKLGTGPLADGDSGRKIFFLGLAGSVAASLLFGLGSGLIFFTSLWAINRIFQSMGWSGLVSVMSRWFKPGDYGTAMGFISINYQFGGVAASLFVGLLISWGLGWRWLFILPALALTLIGLITSRMIVNSPRLTGYPVPDEAATSGVATAENNKNSPAYQHRLRGLLGNRCFLSWCGISFILTLLRECFNLWMPAYFADTGSTASVAAFKSTVFPLLGCAGTLFAGWFSDRHLKGRRAPIMSVLILALALCLLGLARIETLAQGLGSLGWTISKGSLAAFLVGLTGFFLLGPYSLVGGGVVALDFGGHETAGTAAGLLDGIGYFGAILAGLGLAKILVVYGWGTAYGLMAVLSLAALVLCAFLWNTKAPFAELRIPVGAPRVPNVLGG